MSQHNRVTILTILEAGNGIGGSTLRSNAPLDLVVGQFSRRFPSDLPVAARPAEMDRRVLSVIAEAREVRIFRRNAHLSMMTAFRILLCMAFNARAL